jgi:ABC-2 type transport system permease protein
MKLVCAIAIREWKHFFQTPFAMVILSVFLLLCGVYFNASLTNYLSYVNPTESTARVLGLNITSHVLVPYFKSMLNVLIFIVPLITMRMFSEEKKLQTYDLLISYPIGPWKILFGKFIGTVTIVLALLFLSMSYSIITIWKGEPYLPIIYTTFLGYALFIIFYVAVGIVASLATENQIVAAIICYVIILATNFIQWLAFISPAPWDKFFANFLLLVHLESFRTGLIFVGDIVAYLGISLFFLLLGGLKIRRHYIR